MTDWLYGNRFLLARRFTQVSVILVLIAGYHVDWRLWGAEPLVGNLTASMVLGAVPLADPFATLQTLAAGYLPTADLLLGAALVVAFYFLVGGRAFCSWVCPVNMVTDGARRLRTWLRIPYAFSLERRLRYGVLGLALLLSALTGVAAFEWVSPISLLHRELIFGMKMGWMAVAGIFLFDLLLLRNGWCGHVCPLGAFYSIVGHFSPLRVRFDARACDTCGECHPVCPEPQVLNLKRLEGTGMVLSGNCTNCGNCINVCPRDALRFGLRLPLGKRGAPRIGSPIERSAA
jgi:ferredoxin-type protein NapH